MPCRRKLENPEKTHDFQHNVDELFPRAIRCLIRVRTHDLLMGGRYLNNSATKAPLSYISSRNVLFKCLPHCNLFSQESHAKLKQSFLYLTFTTNSLSMSPYTEYLTMRSSTSFSSLGHKTPNESPGM